MAPRPDRATGKKKRSLWPKEHGAYGQLLLPLAAALAMGRPTLVSALLVVAAIAAFLAHEPLLVLLGARGPRVRQDHGGRALRLGVVSATVALASGGLALFFGGSAVLLAAALPLVLVACFAPVVLRGLEKTTGGELLASSALSAASLPVAVAGGVGIERALAALAAWVVAFAVSTAAVRWVIARHKVGRGGRLGLVVAVLGSLAVALLALESWVVLAALPMVIAGWLLMARPPHPRHLRRVGWALVASSSLTAVLVVLFVRLDTPAPVADCCASPRAELH